MRDKYELEVQQFESQISELTVKLREFEKKEKKQMIDKDRTLLLEEQVRQLQEKAKNMQTDRDILDQDKRMVQEFLKEKE